ncbi:MAG: GIY-YIG nuclease family protein [Tepidanaerobacteraceae bacterium]
MASKIDKKRRKELLEQYKQIKTYIGIIQIKNNVNGKIFIDTCSNLKNRWFTLKWNLDMGRHPNSKLQKDWNELGQDAFAYEVLEKKEADKVDDIRWELKKMKNNWLEKLQPYEDRGYNKPLRE